MDKELVESAKLIKEVQRSLDQLETDERHIREAEKSLRQQKNSSETTKRKTA